MAESEQGSLFVEPVEVPRGLTEFLAGYVSKVAFGEKPSAKQKRAAERAGRELGEHATRLAGELRQAK